MRISDEERRTEVVTNEAREDRDRVHLRLLRRRD